ncbi:hypothetical protein DFH29DRAFT_533190 [Suillus ampliporus]|nr:hypothetical protein DFH29DRAFT_533190 [Suillus ampliporus]
MFGMCSTLIRIITLYYYNLFCVIALSSFIGFAMSDHLPLILPDRIPRTPALTLAYQRCLDLYSQAPLLTSTPPPLVCSRLLGYMLIYAPRQHPEGNK